ncbi:MAG: hypothetical protein J5I52_07045 [Saprospiraceae bacterium]|nr:MAG: hypothetical protein UZ09_BCD002000559 [Bacteroidetes bacterium OLB9]MCO6463888.1 hypothetical protein [Saprospiraceae bacterium]
MKPNYWTKDETRQEIITKTKIPSKANFNLFATYFNLMDKKGLSFQLNINSEIENDKLFIKNGFYYLILQLGDIKEFLILPNDNLPELVGRVVSKIDDCSAEIEVLDLLIAEM